MEMAKNAKNGKMTIFAKNGKKLLNFLVIARRKGVDFWRA